MKTETTNITKAAIKYPSNAAINPKIPQNISTKPPKR